MNCIFILWVNVIVDPKRMKGWIGLVSWQCGWFTHISGHPSAAGRVQRRERSPVRSTFYHCATQPQVIITCAMCICLQLCSRVRLVPESYLEFKNVLINECNRLGHLRLAHARALIKIDVNKTRKIYDFLVSEHVIATKRSTSSRGDTGKTSS